jgi:hypothetical protein
MDKIHPLDFSSTTFFQENENNFEGLRSRLKPSSAGGSGKRFGEKFGEKFGEHFGERTEMIRTCRKFS